LGVARYGQRRFEDAITAFLKVIAIDPQVDQPYVFLGKMLDQAGTHLPEITLAYEKWLAANPRNAMALMLLAKVRLASDSKDATAEGLLRKSILLDGKNWEAHYELGVLLEGKRDWAGAAASLKRSAELDGKQAMPHYHLARVYNRLGEGEKAKAERELHEKLTGPQK
jgi:tetratricopeptide (TPR) repeat protein